MSQALKEQALSQLEAIYGDDVHGEFWNIELDTADAEVWMFIWCLTHQEDGELLIQVFANGSDSISAHDSFDTIFGALAPLISGLREYPEHACGRLIDKAIADLRWVDETVATLEDPQATATIDRLVTSSTADAFFNAVGRRQIGAYCLDCATQKWLRD